MNAFGFLHFSNVWSLYEQTAYAQLCVQTAQQTIVPDCQDECVCV